MIMGLLAMRLLGTRKMMEENARSVCTDTVVAVDTDTDIQIVRGDDGRVRLSWYLLGKDVNKQSSTKYVLLIQSRALPPANPRVPVDGYTYP